MALHPSAIVSSDADVDELVDIGPYAIIEANSSIGAGTRIGAFSIIRSHTHIGKNNTIAEHVALGGEPQDISYAGEVTRLQIGDDNIIREFSSIHRSTSADRPTQVGSRNYIMCNSHIGHDCRIGDDVIITSYVGVSGHVQIDDHAVIGGSVGIHQFCRIGQYAMVAGFTPVRKDVLPFCMLGGNPVRHYRLNTVGLRRAGIKGERYRILEKVFRDLRHDLHHEPDVLTEETRQLQAWITAPSKRGIYGFL